MPGKPLDQVNLQKDLQYVLHGTYLHEVFFKICPPAPGLKVLEPGCGSAKFAISYALAGADVTALDLDLGVLAYAKELAALVNAVTGHPLKLLIQQGSIHKLTAQYGTEAFDFVLNEGLIHHWSDWRRQSCVNQMVRVTKRGGWVCTVCSNALCPEMMAYAARVDHTYQGMPPRQRPLTPTELQMRLQRAGLQAETVKVESVGGDLERSMLIAGWGQRP